AAGCAQRQAEHGDRLNKRWIVVVLLCMLVGVIGFVVRSVMLVVHALAHTQTLTYTHIHAHTHRYGSMLAVHFFPTALAWTQNNPVVIANTHSHSHALTHHTGRSCVLRIPYRRVGVFTVCARCYSPFAYAQVFVVRCIQYLQTRSSLCHYDSR